MLVYCCLLNPYDRVRHRRVQAASEGTELPVELTKGVERTRQ